MKLNCITADDEPLALGLVSSFVQQTPFLNLAGQFANGVETLQALHHQPVHLVFLDIQMPNLNGMELARIISQTHSLVQTKIVFTTAYNQFAVEGYKVDALYYLMKPFGYEEFLGAAIKAKNYFEQLTGNAISAGGVQDNCMFVKSDYKIVRVDFEAILYIESIKDYVKIHLAPPAAPIITLSRLKTIEDKLPPAKFLRIHRSFIVAIHKVDSISKNVVQVGKASIPVGELYRDTVKELMGL
ncbi:MAG: LytTR family DNA-binding domain-containing protein [Spirosomataceae bacterium]